jgi:preprotein translocase subunit YajC
VDHLPWEQHLHPIERKSVSPHLLVQSLTAQAAQPSGGGTSWLLPLMLVAMVLLLWLPMRRQKKATAQMKEKQASMAPGTEVMTSFGLYGTVRAIDRDENKAVLEIAPGTSVTVHLQTVTTVVDEQPATAADAEPAGDLGARPAPGEDLPGSTSAEVRDEDTPRDPGQRSD